MPPDLTIRNAKIVLPDAVISGALAVRDGKIAAIDPGPAATGEDFAGDYLIPGLVELHTDQLENHYHPRPDVFWDAMAALQAHDVQVAGSGITTVFDALRIGSDSEMPSMGDHVETLIGAVMAARSDGLLRAEHLIHLRCELPRRDVVDEFERFYNCAPVKLVSMMDHTPGQRQYQTIAKYVGFYQPRLGLSDAAMAAFVADRLAEYEKYSRANRAAILARGHAAGLSFASHDDTSAAHIAEALADGVTIAEFPTTLVAAEAAHAGDLAVLMGAPNIVRGQSHSGNISASELARAGLLDVLSSDYIPFALMQAAFLLPERIEGVSLSTAIAMVSANPARAVGLVDRGEIVVGKRADLVRVRVIGGTPVVRSVWAGGVRVS